MLVEGPAGIGKTRVLAEAVKSAAEAGFLVREARGGEMEREMPFGVARQLFEPLIERADSEERATWLSGSARHALVALGHVDPDGAQQEMDALTAINGLYWLVANLADARPVLLVMDDAHWSDSDSLRFVSFLARRVAELPICVILGARTGEADEPVELNALRLECPVTRPQPLSPPSVHELITARVGETPSQGFSSACATATAGNPFLIVEILRELGSVGATLDAATVESMTKLAPENVARSVLFRLGRFGDEAIALARSIAVLGRAPQLRHAAQLAEIDVDLAATLCDRLRDAEILAPGLPLDFVHPLVRQAIYQEQSDSHRSAIHRRAAEMLSAANAEPVEIAAHLLSCAPTGDQWVVEQLHAAAGEAMTDAGCASAVTYLERALQEPPDDPASILITQGVALVETDPFRAPLVLARAVDQATDPGQKVDVLRRLAWAHLTAGNLVEGANRCDEAIAIAGKDDRELVLALEAQAFFMRAAAVGIDDERSARIEEVAADLKGDTAGERVARHALGVQRFLTCAPVNEVIDLCSLFPEPPWEIEGAPSPVPFAAGKILAWSGRTAEGRAEFARWLDVRHRQGALAAMSAGYGFVSEIDRLSGEFGEAEAEARIAWDIAESMGQFSSFGWSAKMNLAASLLARGDLQGFEQFMGDFDLSLGPLEVPLNPWPIEIRAHLHLAKGDLALAVEDFVTLGSALEDRMGWLNPVYPSWRQEAAEALAALGRTKEAEELLTVAEQRAATYGAPIGIASAMRARAFLQARKKAIETLDRAATIYEASGPPHELARTLTELGSALRRDGQRSAAREPLHRALELAARCGAGGLERRIRDELAAVGSRPRRVARSGVAALTASELKVATLAGDGFNNREIAERLFVTRRTVETHLTHVYEKLGIAGRGELQPALAEEGSEAL